MNICNTVRQARDASSSTRSRWKTQIESAVLAQKETNLGQLHSLPRHASIQSEIEVPQRGVAFRSEVVSTVGRIRPDARLHWQTHRFIQVPASETFARSGIGSPTRPLPLGANAAFLLAELTGDADEPINVEALFPPWNHDTVSRIRGRCSAWKFYPRR